MRVLKRTCLQGLFFLIVPLLSYSQTQLGGDINGEAAGDSSGVSVSASSDGRIVAIGARKNDGNGTDSGHVRVYEYVNNQWVQKGEDIDGEAAGDYSGISVSVSSDGHIVAIGADENSGNGLFSGHVRIYEYINDQWEQRGGDIDGEGELNWSSTSLSLSSDGDVVAIGAPENIVGEAILGHVRVFEYVNTQWVQRGEDIDGEADSDYSGASISLSSDGNIVAIGARENDGNGTESGHVRIYEYVNNQWVQLGADINGETAGDFLGESVSLSSDGHVVAIGAARNSENGTESGHVRIYEYINNQWIQKGEDIDGEAAGDFSGSEISLSADGNVIAIAAIRNDGNGPESGHVRVYQYIDNQWIQQGIDIDGEAAGDFFGSSVSLSSDGSIVAIGAINNAGNGDNSGHVRVYDLSTTLRSEAYQLSAETGVYPIPTKDKVYITLANGLELKKLAVYNTLGQLIKMQNAPLIEMSALAKGLYYLELQTNRGRITKTLKKD